MRVRRLLFAMCSVLICVSAVAAGNGFQPVSPDELKMTSEPLAPGAPAIILYRQVDRDDTGLTAHENDYVRIKVLTEEGRKYADVEIPYLKENGNEIVNIKARTINPDGSISNFNGKAFDKSIVKAKGLKYMAKTFTLPNVRVGSILEYYYTLDLSEHYVYDSHWILSDELFTKHAKFSLNPYTESGMSVRWTWQGLPQGTNPPSEGNNRVVRLEAMNIPAFKTEDYMPPANELKARVDFTYSTEPYTKDVTQFWKKRGKKLSDSVESFIGKRKAMETTVAQIVAATDSPEIKVHKIYDYVQKLRNTSYEVQKTEQQRKRDKEKPASNVEDIVKKGYGNGVQLTWLFLGLVRAAGIEAYPVMVSDRRNYFFRSASMDDRKLDSNVVLVKLNGKDIYCDPGGAFTPFGLLDWAETGVTGLRLDKNGGSWITTPLPDSSASRIERRATLNLMEGGDLEGKLSVTFTGIEAMNRRVEERNEDETARKKYLEDEVKEYIPAASEIELTNKPDWSGSATPLVGEFKMKIPGWIAGAGHRALMPVGIFTATEKSVFDHTERVYPIYFEFPYEDLDDVSVTLPPGWSVNSVPPPEDQENNAVGYVVKVENEKQTLHLTRKLRINLLLVDTKYYPSLREFFQTVRKGDEQQILLQPGTTRAAQ